MKTSPYHRLAVGCLVAAASILLTPPLTSQDLSGAANGGTTISSRVQAIGIIADDRKIVTRQGIEELLPVKINGAKQWISIRGKNKNNPILLFLHGGPGSPFMPTSWTVQSGWEDYFTVVQWDERGAGKTYVSNDPEALAPTMTIEQLTEDAADVVRYLRDRFGERKIFLLGHSFGSILGLELVQRHPEWFYAYIGVGQVVNTVKNEEEAYQFAFSRAVAQRNTEAIDALKSLAPYPGDPRKFTLYKLATQRTWLIYFGGQAYGRTSMEFEDNAQLLSPEYTEADLNARDAAQAYSVSLLLPDLFKVDFSSVRTIECPVFLFEGRHDYTVSHTIAAKWFEQLNAPGKKLVWFENSAHMVMEEEPGRFLVHLVNDVLPIASRTTYGF